MMRRHVRMIELHDDPATAAAYEHAHLPGNTPAEVLASQRRHGIAELAIYRLGNRLVMVMDVTDAFDPDGLDRDAEADPVLVDWHRRMGGFQKPLPGHDGWAAMPCIFLQTDHP